MVRSEQFPLGLLSGTTETVRGESGMGVEIGQDIDDEDEDDNGEIGEPALLPFSQFEYGRADTIVLFGDGNCF